jgi:hypothetical protein
MKFNKILLILLPIFTANSDCNFEYYNRKVNQYLKGYSYLRSYKLDNTKSTEHEFSYMFSVNTTYKIAIAGAEKESDVLVSIYDSKRNLLFSNLDNNQNRYFQSIGFECTATAVYYIRYSFKSAKSKCATSVISFKK